jgi:hypothetical protein
VLTPKTELVNFEFLGNPLSFKNGTEILSNGRGWYTAVGNGTLVNACFFALNAVLNQVQQITKEVFKITRPAKMYLEKSLDKYNRFVYTAFTEEGVPLDKQFNLPKQNVYATKPATILELEKLQSKYALH